MMGRRDGWRGRARNKREERPTLRNKSCAAVGKARTATQREGWGKRRDRASDTDEQQVARQQAWHLVHASRRNWTYFALNCGGLDYAGFLKWVEYCCTVGFFVKIQAILRHRATCERKGKRQTATPAAVAFLAGWPSLLAVSRLPQGPQAGGGVAPQPPLLQPAIRHSKSKRRGRVEFAGRIPLPLLVAAVGRGEPGAPTATRAPPPLVPGGVRGAAQPILVPWFWFAWHCHRLALPGASAQGPARGGGAGAGGRKGARPRRGEAGRGSGKETGGVGRGSQAMSAALRAASCQSCRWCRTALDMALAGGRDGWIGGVVRGGGVGLDLGGGGGGGWYRPPAPQPTTPPPARERRRPRQHGSHGVGRRPPRLISTVGRGAQGRVCLVGGERDGSEARRSRTAWGFFNRPAGLWTTCPTDAAHPLLQGFCWFRAAEPNVSGLFPPAKYGGGS